MLKFTIDTGKCIRCGQCAADCPTRIITTSDGLPAIPAEKEAACYRCQHCLAICPTAALSILGRLPEASRPLAGAYPDPDNLETLIKGRRSVRLYLDENLEPALLQRLLEVAWHAPTGINSRQVRLTVVDDRDKLAAFREQIMAGLSRLVRDGELPEGLGFFADFVRLWEDKGVDTLFRGAPHFLVASAPQEVVSPLPDCLIALSYFELFAQANGVGTVWDGLAKIAIDTLLPETRQILGIPEDHLIGYAMAFGRPAVSYARTVQHGPALIHRI
ncbi:nitroreductase family protein [Geobacter sp. SVR]|uniref:nitroreductase family protein n=1 Tax=Geobacter sp. SVR TaxID=2495594 RepID=UPI00143EF5F6|nr:nitroreductase family protein [Geobacter sp. SVR]BCS54598.1 nitroreductase [Geobacter sp. SVR]GCF86895.1 nitroreductase [Geobacter sp. SVR]